MTVPLGAKTRVLVTGGTGYIGSRLIAALVDRGCAVHAIVRSTSPRDRLGPAAGQVTFHVHDATREDHLVAIASAAAPDLVYHLAAYFVAEHTPKDVIPLVDSNVGFGTLLLDALGRTGTPVRFVNTSTVWQHYEGRPYSPVDLYAATKQAFEAILQFYVETRSMAAITLELFDTYGPDDPRPKILSLLRRVAHSQTRLDMSGGEQEIDLVYIDDVVRAFLLAGERVLNATSAQHEKFGVWSGAPVTLRELVAVCSRVTGVDLPIAWGARPYRAREMMHAWRVTERLPGWTPAVALERGLAQSAIFS